MDDDGLVSAVLRDELVRLAALGRTPKFLYTVPNFHNPAGVTLAVSRRAEVLEICADHSVLVLEDNAYGLLGFDGQTYPAMRASDPGNVVYLGSFSKTFAPGLRVGWVLAPHAVRDLCWPRSPPRCARRRSPRPSCRATWQDTTGRVR